MQINSSFGELVIFNSLIELLQNVLTKSVMHTLNCLDSYIWSGCGPWRVVQGCPLPWCRVLKLTAWNPPDLAVPCRITERLEADLPAFCNGSEANQKHGHHSLHCGLLRTVFQHPDRISQRERRLIMHK